MIVHAHILITALLNQVCVHGESVTVLYTLTGHFNSYTCTQSWNDPAADYVEEAQYIKPRSYRAEVNVHIRLQNEEKCDYSVIGCWYQTDW